MLLQIIFKIEANYYQNTKEENVFVEIYILNFDPSIPSFHTFI